MFFQPSVLRPFVWERVARAAEDRASHRRPIRVAGEKSLLICPGSGGQLSWISAADNCRPRTWGMQRIIILRMTWWPIQTNLWAGPDPRDDEDFRNLQSQNITAVLSLQDEEDRGDGGIESERAAAARVGLAFESVPVKDFS